MKRILYTIILDFFISVGPFSSWTSPSPFTQTDWSGGQGENTRNQFSRASNLNTSNPRQLTLSSTSDWVDTAWQYRKKITFNNADQAEDLRNFPLLIKLNATYLDFSKATNGGEDILFIDADGTTPLAYEIERWNSTPGSEEAIIWVKIPQIDAGSRRDFIYMYYGNPAASDRQSPADVWWNNFRGVWHFKEDPSGVAPQMRDSTRNRHHGSTRNGISTSNQVLGPLGRALSFNGINYYIDVAHDQNLDYTGQDRTFSAWIKIDPDEGGSNFISKPLNGSGEYSYRLTFHPNNTLYFCLAGDHEVCLNSNSTLSKNEWHQVVFTVDSSRVMKIFIDGIEKNSRTHDITRWTPRYPYNPNVYRSLVLGSIYPYGNTWVGNESYSLKGSLDEIRIASTVHSSDWIAATYKSETGTFNSFGAEERPYVSTGALTSSILDSGAEGTHWENIQFSTNHPSGTVVKGRTSGTAAMIGTPDFSTCAPLANGADISTNNCVTQGHRYLQYFIQLEGNSSSPPVFEGISIAFTPSSLDSQTSAPGGVTFTETHGSTEVIQKGAGDSYLISLTSPPTAEVTLSLHHDSTLVVSPETLTFTPSNWNISQEVNLTAVDPDKLLIRENTTSVITHRTASSDARYQGLALRDMAVAVKSSEQPSSSSDSSPTTCSLRAMSTNEQEERSLGGMWILTLLFLAGYRVMGEIKLKKNLGKKSSFSF